MAPGISGVGMTDLYVGASHGFAAAYQQHRRAQGHVCYSVSSRPGPLTCEVDWSTVNPSSLHQWAQTLPDLDLVFFNQNASALSVDSFAPRPTLQLWQHVAHWQQNYFVSCQLPYVLLQTLGTRISSRTRVVWMLSGMVTRPFDDPGHADYIGNKYQNMLIMRNFAQHGAGCYIGIDPGAIAQGCETQQTQGLDAVLALPRDQANGNVFGLDGAPAQNFDIFS